MASSTDLDVTSPEIDQLVRSKPFYDRFRSLVGLRVMHEVQLHDPIHVEHTVTDDQLSQIMNHIQKVWTRLGKEEPHWSVVSTAQFKPDKISETLADFHATGKSEAANLTRILKRNGLAVPPSAVALEYGCGVGRVTRWLATQFGSVIGVDISANHLALARQYFAAEGVSNVELKHVSQLSDIDRLPQFDFLYSKIVLQHNPPPIIHRILNTLCGKLRPGGALVVQVPTYRIRYKWTVDEYLKEMGDIEKMEMHLLPQHVVFDIFDNHDCVPREVSRDHLVATVDFVSTTFVAVKRGRT
jgi:SAM-dependent methyltransferase